MASAPDDSSLSSDQDTNQFLVEAGIESQISYTTIRDFTSWANWNPPTGSYFILLHLKKMKRKGNHKKKKKKEKMFFYVCLPWM